MLTWFRSWNSTWTKLAWMSSGQISTSQILLDVANGRAYVDHTGLTSRPTGCRLASLSDEDVEVCPTTTLLCLTWLAPTSVHSGTLPDQLWADLSCLGSTHRWNGSSSREFLRLPLLRKVASASDLRSSSNLVPSPYSIDLLVCYRCSVPVNTLIVFWAYIRHS